MDLIASESRIIITRPEGQAGDLVEQLQSLNAELSVQHLPLIEIQPLQYSVNRSRFDKAIFISRNAVNYFFVDTLPTISSYFAVGKPTAKILEKHIKQMPLFPEQMNADGLVAMEELRAVEGEEILLVKGEGGRSLIYDELTSRGAKVTELDVYRRKLPELAAQKAIINSYSSHNIWMITSAEAISNLYRILGLSNKPHHQTKLIVSSDRLSEVARNKGFQIVAQSAGATDRQLVQCVKSLFSDQDNT